MSTVKINCPKCVGTGLTGSAVESTCSQCKGTGMISVTDTDTLSTINAASATPLVVTSPTAVAKVAIKVASRQRDN